MSSNILAAAKLVDILTKHRAEIGRKLRKAQIEAGKLAREYEHAQTVLIGALADLGEALDAEPDVLAGRTAAEQIGFIVSPYYDDGEAFDGQYEVRGEKD